MGFFKDFAKGIGNIVKDSAISGISQGIRQTEMNNRWGILGINGDSFDIVNEENEIIGGEDMLFGFNNQRTHPNIKDYSSFISKHSQKFSGVTSNIGGGQYVADETGNYNMNLPYWNYADFINERNIFIRHLSSGYDEPGWFYFKLFFDFDSNHGLLGGILNNSQGGVNSALKYFTNCSGLYSIYNLHERIQCLEKFVHLLSYINLNAPWFFKSVKNLSAAGNPVINNFNEEKSIEIELNQDAIDMRLTTLLSLYKFICYDDIFNVEVLPENLRKFDLCIVIFESPIKLLHTPIYDGNLAKTKFKGIGSSSLNNYMSFKLYKFMNCEIDPSTIGGNVPDVQNDNPFQLGQNTLKINYDKVYEYTMNEIMGEFMVGSDGIYLNDNEHITVIDSDINSSFTTLSENFIRDNIGKILKGHSNFALGNIYGQDKGIYKESLSGSIDRNAGLSKSFTDYFIQKSSLLSNKLTSNTSTVMNTGFDILYKLLGTSYHAGTSIGPSGDGTVLNGHGQHGIGSAVWQAKMDRLMHLESGPSNREQRITAVNNAQNANWKKRLHDLAVGEIKTPRL